MTQIMKGIRVLEIAQHTFVPSAGAVKHNPNRHTLVENANRGKRSVGIDVSKPEGQQVVSGIAKTSDVFLTNYLPAANPNIIYARGLEWARIEQLKAGGVIA